ncbi:hypothetical protein [Roseinatronobacter bogoriensis]|uniref:Uncharacterized protein n=1 Tax=Roseinatronobacter bogoriensis subsp. barguzinensis TaxID=441209 RepID=A0A2K8KD52_9RHOB|nr:hypothetical protein [Rhodobaca bogoriensis]ATX67381.1 hypothetical protein BG454_17490 [Rhodobaca barguzinensis]
MAHPPTPAARPALLAIWGAGDSNDNRNHGKSVVAVSSCQLVTQGRFSALSCRARLILRAADLS